MNAISRRRWLSLGAKTLLMVLAVVYLLYLLLGYFYLPGKLKTLAETTGSQTLGRTVSAQEFSYNPFTFELTSNGFAIADKPGQALLQWQQLRINIGFWASLWQRHLVIEEIELSKPETYIRQQATGFNFDPIIARLNELGDEAPQEPDSKDDSASFAFSVLLLSIDQGNALYRDSSGAEDVDVKINDLSITFNDLYFATGDELLNPFSISAALAEGGELSLAGEYRLQPLRFDMALEAADVNLTAFSDFLHKTINADLTRGNLSAKAQLYIASDATHNQTAIKLTQGALSFSDLALDDQVQQPPMLRTQQLDVSGIELDLLARRVRIGALEYRGLLLNQWQTNEGEFRYESLLVKTGTESNVKAATHSEPADEPQWSVIIDDFVLRDSAINFSDQHVTPAVQWQLSDINIHATPLRLTDSRSAELSASARVNNNSNITINGQLTPVPLSLDIAIEHSPFELSIFNPYLALDLNAAIAQGTIANTGSLKLALNPELSIDMQANTTVQSLSVINSETQSPLLGFEQLQVNNIQFNVPSLSTQIDSIELQKPVVTLLNDATPNWDVAVNKPTEDDALETDDSDAKQPTDTPTSDDTAPHFTLDKLVLNEGQVHFTDRLQSPEFIATVNTLNVQLTGLDNQGSTPAKVTADALLNKHAPFNLAGEFTINPKALSADLSGNLAGFELVPMSSYSGTFIGYNIKKGKLNYDFDYKIADSKIKGNNHIVAKSFDLGDSVASEQAIKAPIKLGIALLRDLQGNIDLDLNISGDMQEPSFNLPGLIASTFVNILIKTAASPFTFLASLVDTSDDLGQLDFAQGSAQLDPANQQKLQQLAKALQQKTSLSLVIRGNASAPQDGPALQALQLAQQLSGQDSASDSATLNHSGFNLDQWLADVVMLTQLERYYAQQTGHKLSQQLDALMAEQSLDKDSARLQLAQQGFTELAAQIPLADNTIEQLADLRAQTIKDYLTQQGLTEQRVTLKPAYSATLTGTTVALTIDAK